MLIVICVVTVACGHSGVPVVSQLHHPHLCRQSVVHCCHRMSIHPGRHTSSCAIFVVFAPRWAAASLVTFLLHQTQSTMHRCHHCTPPPLCRSRHHLAHHPPTTVLLFLCVVFVAASPPLPMAGCCVLGRRCQTSLTLSSTFLSPLDPPVAITSLNPAVC